MLRAVGIGVNDSAVCASFARDADVDCVLPAGWYSLLEQGALDTFLPLAASRGIGVMLGGVFSSGILATGAQPGAHYNYQPATADVLQRVARIESLCTAHAVALAHAAVRFPLAHPGVASVVVGAVTAAEVERNIAAFSTPVPAAFWNALASRGLLRSDAPLPA